jgi:chromosome segregation ATPase
VIPATLWIRIVIYGIIVGLAGSAIWWAAILPRQQLSAEREAHAATKLALAELKVKAAEDLASAVLQAKTTEEALQAAVDYERRTLDEVRTELKKRDTALAAARNDARGLRQQLTNLGTGVRVSKDPNASLDAVTALSQVAGQCADLLDEGRQLLRQCARDHDERAAEVTSLLKAWPSP